MMKTYGLYDTETDELLDHCKGLSEDHAFDIFADKWDLEFCYIEEMIYEE